MAKAKRKDKEETMQERMDSVLRNQLKELEGQLLFMELPPTRLFEVGERVTWGGHKEVYIEEVLHKGMIYKLKSIFHKDPTNHHHYDLKDRTVSYAYQLWSYIFPFEARSPLPQLSASDSLNIYYANSDISSLLHKHYFSGIDYTPEYQRDYVWSLEDKIALIESIMNNIDIGKFTFVYLSFEEAEKRYGRNFEILDGKQRMKAIIEFYEDRFEYKGKKFSELSFPDVHAFKGHPISHAELRDVTKEQILRTFIKLNTTGRVMEKEHIERVREAWLKEMENDRR